jgi:hypothetical protein
MTKADKDNTLIIMKNDDYNNKRGNFINNNNFTVLSQDNANKQQQNIRNRIKIAKKCYKTQWKLEIYKYELQRATYTRNYKIA